MDEYILEHDSGQKCPSCGLPLIELVMALGSQKYVRLADCQCVITAKDMAREKELEFKKAKLRQAVRNDSGLKLRQQSQTFSTFYPVDGQTNAHIAAKAFVSSGPVEKGMGLLFVGGVGSGKSHLSAAIVNALIDAMEITNDEADSQSLYGKGDFVFVGAVELLERIRRSYSDGNTEKIVGKYANAQLLVIDDIGAEKATEWTMERLFEIVDHRYNQYLPMIITSNLRPEELKTQMGGRVYDRIRAICQLVPVTAKGQRKTAGAKL